MNNIPTMLSRDDFQAQHKDMLVSACCEPLSKEEIEARRKPKFSMKGVTEYAPGFFMLDAMKEKLEELKGYSEDYEAFKADNAKIDSPLRVRLPKDYVGYWAK